MHSLLNNIFVNCNDYMLYCLTRIVGVSSIYYRKLYNYININNNYACASADVDADALCRRCWGTCHCFVVWALGCFCCGGCRQDMTCVDKHVCVTWYASPQFHPTVPPLP